MSETILQSISKERELLNYPKAQKPSVHQFYSATVRNFQDMYNEVSNTDEAWTLGESNIEVANGQDTYSIPGSIQPVFGKPLLLTTFSTDDFAIERTVPFWDIQNLKFDWFMPNNYAGWNPFPTGGDHTAERVSFFYDTNGIPKLRFSPVPQYGATYRLKYSIGNWADSANIGSSAILKQHHHLFEVRSAKDTLHMCEWETLDRKETMEYRKDVRAALDEMEMRYLPAFKRYIKEMTHDGIVFKKTWDE